MIIVTKFNHGQTVHLMMGQREFTGEITCIFPQVYRSGKLIVSYHVKLKSVLYPNDLSFNEGELFASYDNLLEHVLKYEK